MLTYLSIGIQNSSRNINSGWTSAKAKPSCQSASVREWSHRLQYFCWEWCQWLDIILPWPRWHLNYFSEPGTSCVQVVFQVFPLHHTPSLENLQKSWVRKLFGLQPLGNKSLKSPSKSLRAGEISEYFGLKIAFYFAWLGHYTTALSIPAIVGGAFWVGVAILSKDTFCSLIVSSFSFTDALSSLKTSASSSFPFSMSRGQHSIWRFSYNQTLTYVVPAYVNKTSK